jgi:hypothetical protein
MKFQLIGEIHARAARCRCDVHSALGSSHGHSYVNGVLDKLAAELRAVEKRG